MPEVSPTRRNEVRLRRHEELTGNSDRYASPGSSFRTLNIRQVAAVLEDEGSSRFPE